MSSVRENREVRIATHEIRRAQKIRSILERIERDQILLKGLMRVGTDDGSNARTIQLQDHGKYLGLIRWLPENQKKQVRAIRKDEGLEKAIEKAQELSEKRLEKGH
jgi:hypothetical protein